MHYQKHTSSYLKANAPMCATSQKVPGTLKNETSCLKRKQQALVYVTSLTKTIIVDVNEVTTFEALLANLSQHERREYSSANSALLRHGRRVDKIRGGDLLQLTETNVLLAGGASQSQNQDDNYVRQQSQRDRLGAEGRKTQGFEVLLSDEESKALKKELTQKAIAKWSKVKAFEDYEDEDSFKVKHLFKDCTIEQLQRIVNLDLAVGYDKDSIKDKMDFFNKLPQTDKEAFLRDFKAQQDKQHPNLMTEASTLAQKLALNMVKNKNLIKSTSSSILFDQEPELEVNTVLQMSNEKDVTVIQEMGDIPKPKKGRDYYFMQLNRLIPVSTLKDMEAKVIFTSTYTQSIKINVPGDLEQILKTIHWENLYKERENEKESASQSDVKGYKSVEDLIMKIFNTNQTNRGKFDDNYPSQFVKMKVIPEAQIAFASKLIDESFIKAKFTEWSVIMSNPELCQGMVTLLNTFPRETQTKFYDMLGKVMYSSDLLKSSLYPELIALNERQNIVEVPLDGATLVKSQNWKQEKKASYITDYPLICYLADKPKSSAKPNSSAKLLVMVNLADLSYPRKEFELKENEKFLAFVEKTQRSHACTIIVLLYDEDNKAPILRTYKYLNPFQVKDFNQDKNWKEGQFEISSQASQVMNKVLFRKDFKQQLAASMVQKILKQKVKDEILTPQKVLSVTRKDNVTGKSMFGLFLQMENMIYFLDIQAKAKQEKAKDGKRYERDLAFKDLELFDRQYSKVRLEIQRGINDDFYFAQSNMGSQCDTLYRVKVEVKDSFLKHKAKKLSLPISGAIVAFEFDPMTNNDVEKPQQLNMVDDWKDKNDKMFIIDERLKLFKVEIDRDCELIYRKNLDEHKIIYEAVHQLVVNKSFVRLGMSDRCISIYGKTYSYQTGQCWDYIFQGNENVRNSKQLYVRNFNLPFSHLQIGELHTQDKSALCIKNDPSSRKICTLDRRRKDALLFEMLCPDRSLVKLKGDQNKYWVMFDKCGFMVHLPAGMQGLLEEQDWTAMHVKPVKTRSKENEIVQGILIVLTYYDVAKVECALPHVASVLLNEDATEMLEYRSDLAIDMQSQADLKPKEVENIRYQGIHSKIVISDSGNVFMLYSNPFDVKGKVKSMATGMDQYEIRNSFGSDLLKLNVIQCPKFCMKYFQSREIAILVDNLIFLKSNEEHNMIRINVVKGANGQHIFKIEENFIQKPMRLPFKGRCILNHTSPLYRCNNAYVKLNADDELQFENQLQISYGRKTFSCTVKNTEFIGDPDRGHFEALQGIDLLQNPERYVDMGIRMSTLEVEMSNEEEKEEEVAIWTHINSHCSTDFYYVHQDWFWASNNNPWLDGEQKHNFSFLGFYRKFCEADIFEMMRLKKLLSDNNAIKDVDDQLFCSEFMGNTAFDAFFKDIPVMQYLVEKLKTAYPIEEDEFGNDMENQDLKRFHCQVTRHQIDRPKALRDQKLGADDTQNEQQKSFIQRGFGKLVDMWTGKKQEEQSTQPNCNSLIFKALYSDNVKCRDLVLEIASCFESFSLSKHLVNQAQIEAMVQQPTQQIVQTFNNILFETPFTKKINTLEIVDDVSVVTFRDYAFKINEDFCQQKVNEELKRQGFKMEEVVQKTQADEQPQLRIPSSQGRLAAVQVKCMPLGWLNQHANFLDFVPILNSTSNKAILETEIVNNLIRAYWDKYRDQIINTQFIPCVLYLIFMLHWMVYALDDDNSHESNCYACVYPVLVGVCSMFIMNQFMIEYTQIKNSSIRDHFSDFWNLNDLAYLTLNTIVVFSNFNGLMDIFYQRVLAAWSAIGLWMKVLDWLRLFDTTAFFISLYEQTLHAIASFMLVMFTWWMTFGTAFYIINLNRAPGSAGDMVPQISHFWAFDSFEMQYEMSMGEVNTDSFTREDGASPAVAYGLYLCSTFLVQLVFLNMLIAIMSDTFAEASLNAANNARISKIEIMADYVHAIDSRKSADTEDDSIAAQNAQEKEEQTGPEYLYVVIVDQEVNDQTAWEGQMGTMKSMTESIVTQGFDKVSKRLNSIGERMQLNQTNQAVIGRRVAGEVNKLAQSVAAFNKESDKQNQELMEHLAQFKVSRAARLRKRKAANDEARGAEDVEEELGEEAGIAPINVGQIEEVELEEEDGENM